MPDAYLAPCPTCGNPRASTAAACPKCGAPDPGTEARGANPVQPPRRRSPVLVVAAVVGVVLGLGWACSKDAPPAQTVDEATAAYEVALNAGDKEAMCDLAGPVADAYGQVGDQIGYRGWRNTRRVDCAAVGR